MNLLPYDKLCITTSLKPDEVEQRLQAEVSPDPGIFSDTPNTYFIGVAQNGQFKVRRVISNRNSFLPIVTGHTETWLNGSILYITMKLHLFTAVFMGLWLGGTVMSGIGFLVQQLITGRSSAMVFAPFGMFLFGYGMMIVAFSYERNKAKDILLQLSDGEIDNTIVCR